MRQASSVKRTTVKPLTSQNRLEIPLPQTTSKNEDILKKIQVKAYELYLQRNGAPGSAEEDWVLAEQIVKGS
jgi:hypothetical protein